MYPQYINIISHNKTLFTNTNNLSNLILKLDDCLSILSQKVKNFLNYVSVDLLNRNNKIYGWKNSYTEMISLVIYIPNVNVASYKLKNKRGEDYIYIYVHIYHMWLYIYSYTCKICSIYRIVCYI